MKNLKNLENTGNLISYKDSSNKSLFVRGTGETNAGIIDIPYQSYISILKTQSQFFDPYTWTKLTFNSVNQDNQNEWNSNNNIFVPKVDGIYLCIVNLTFYTDVEIKSIIEFYLNGNPTGYTSYQDFYDTRGDTSVQVTHKLIDTIALSANDELSVYGYHDASPDLGTYTNNTNKGRFHVFKLG